MAGDVILSGSEGSDQLSEIRNVLRFFTSFRMTCSGEFAIDDREAVPERPQEAQQEKKENKRLKRIVSIVLPVLVVALMCGAAQAGYLNNSITETRVPISGSGYNAYMGGFDYDSNGDIVAYTGKAVVRVTERGTETLYSSTENLGSSFVKVDSSTGDIYFGESSNGTIKVIHGGGAHTVATIANNYDMAIDQAGRLFISAANDMWTESYIYTIGANGVVQIGTVDGPSGPLAIGANGDLYYGTASSDFYSYGTQGIMKWSSDLLNQALAGTASLSAANADSVISGTDNVSSMAFDANGTLYYTTSQQYPSTIWKVSDGSQRVLTGVNTAAGYHWLTTLRYDQTTGLLGVNVGGVYEGFPLGIVATTEVPEPSALASLASFAGFAFLRRRRRSSGS